MIYTFSSQFKNKIKKYCIQSKSMLTYPDSSGKYYKILITKQYFDRYLIENSHWRSLALTITLKR